MKQEKIEDNELNQVTGGYTNTVSGGAEMNSCPKCSAQYDKNGTYPTGFFVNLSIRRNSEGVYGVTDYRCPKCGYKWTE